MDAHPFFRLRELLALQQQHQALLLVKKLFHPVADGHLSTGMVNCSSDILSSQ
jgi:hypothetical protein